MMKQKVINIILFVIATPLILFEYFILFWFWGGADVFNLFVTPLAFIGYTFFLNHLKKKINIKDSLAFLLKILLIIILPILTMITVWGIAFVFGIDIVIL